MYFIVLADIILMIHHNIVYVICIHHTYNTIYNELLRLTVVVHWFLNIINSTKILIVFFANFNLFFLKTSTFD